MTMLPPVLGLPQQEALARLEAAGFADAAVLVSGRRREGRPRVIRQRFADGRVELVVSYFKELMILPLSPSGDIPL
jgi:hypothetical protein